MRVAVVIPALNEEDALPLVLAALPCALSRVIVVDNGSRDRTAEIARRLGATVVSEPRRGYGFACLAGTAALDERDVVTFLDADFADAPELLPLVSGPVLRGEADFVLGCRRGPGRPWHARLGTLFCVHLINALWGTRYRDLGPFRAMRVSQLRALAMNDKTYGWTIEMQVKAAETGLRTLEIDVPYRPRVGRSKVSGTIRGTVGAGIGMLSIIAGLYVGRHRRAGRLAVGAPTA